MPQPTTELNLSGTWTDVSSYVFYEDGITITRGRSEWASTLEPSRASLTFDDRDGRFDPRNPVGAYYGSIGRNTPIRISANNGTPFLNLLGGSSDNASTPDAAALDITGDIDIRIELYMPDWDTGALIDLAAKYETTGDQRSWALWLTASGTLNWRWTTAGTLASATDKESTAAVTVPASGRMALRITHDVDNGAVGNTVTFYTSSSITGTWTQLGSAVVTAGTTSIFSSSAPVEVGNITDLTGSGPVGRVQQFRILNGIAGTEVANPDFTAQTVGAASFADSAGRTWTMNGNTSISRKRIRFVGEVSSWPPRWDITTTDIRVPIEASGVSRRLGQGASPLESTLRRRIPTDANILAYWPMEDGENATQAASPIVDVSPLTVSGLTFAAVDTLPGSSPLPTLASGAFFSGQVPTGSNAGWFVEMVYRLDTALPATVTTLFQVQVENAGSDVQKVIVRTSTAGIVITALDSTGATVATATNSSADAITGFTGQWNRLAIYAVDDGANTDITARWIPIESSTTYTVDTTYSGDQGDVHTVTTGAVSVDYAGIAVGHLAVFNSGSSTIFDSADHGFNGERATARIERLCGEEGISFIEAGTSTASELMGAQARDTLLDLLASCADADGGLLFEGREATSIAYRDRANLYNQDAAIALNYTAFDLYGSVEPVDDDQLVRNKITVTRSGGSSGTVEETTGALSTQAPPNGVGTYAEAATLSLYKDTQAQQIAGWRVHLGTVDELRLPQISMHLARSVHTAADIAEALDADIGDRLTVSNPPTAAGPNTISQIVQGYTEKFDQFEHVITYNCTPQSPYQVGEVSDTTLGRADTAGSELTEALTTTETDVDVLTTSGPLWVTTANNPSEFPFDIAVGGERMTVTSATSSVLDDFSAAQTDSWGTADVGGTWTNTNGVAADFDVLSGYGRHIQTATGANLFSTIPAVSADFDIYCDMTTAATSTGASQLTSIVARYTNTSNHYMARLEFTTGNVINLTIFSVVAGVATQLGTFTSSLTHAAGTYSRARFQGYGSALKTKVWQVGQVEPGVWHIEVTNTALTSAGSAGVRSRRDGGNTNANADIRFDNFDVVNPQIFTVTRSVNSVVKTQASGATVRLFSPSKIAL